MAQQQDRALEERRKFVSAFNSTMIKIWREQIVALKVIDTGLLYSSVMAIGCRADGKFYSVELSQSFKEYGMFVDMGTGRNTPRGNPGDLGRDNPRQRRRWFSRKHFASVMNLREFYSENIGKHAANVISDSLSAGIRRRFGSRVSDSVF
ncbi:MAG: hypothetical protein K2N21_01075 [Rikenellaceae bacterium]|nr:hypothetical protein [Rikenellaceae bacterium]